MHQIRTMCILALASVAFAVEDMVVDNSRVDMYSSMCASEKHGNLLADPYDCAQFIQCDYGKASVKKCSPGLRYDTRLQVCNWEHEVQCEAYNPGTTPNEGPVRCFGYDTLHFIADTRDCEKYYICANGVPYEHQCAPGIHWDYLNNQCESPAKAQCVGKGDNNAPEETSTAITTPVTSPVTQAVTETTVIDDTPDCTTGQRFFGCSDSCAEYYVCVEDVAWKMKCAEGYFWSEDAMKCEVPELSRCFKSKNGSIL